MPAEPLRHRAFLCLGSNVGERAGTMATALERLATAGVEITARSSLYETPPWGPVPQGPYLNQVVEVLSPLDPHALLTLALSIERELGRDRSREVRYGPRRIDIDILWIEGHVIDDEVLQLPHPRILERAFVLVPLSEIAPDLVVGGMRVSEAVKRLDATDITRLPAI